MVIPMREQQFRSHDQAVALPLTAEARGEVASFQFGSALNVAAIGHTHHARIAVHDTAEEFFALGANEARIYQLSPLE
jgi:hypothetical protein